MDSRKRPNRPKLTEMVKLADKFKITLIDLPWHVEEKIFNRQDYHRSGVYSRKILGIPRGRNITSEAKTH